MNVVTERNFSEMYPREIREAYWDNVRRSLVQIFGAPGSLADAYWTRIETAPASEQLMVYHQEPIDVAADLAGVSEISPAQQELYIEICCETEPPRRGWPDSP
jgi:hypothetical protein